MMMIRKGVFDIRIKFNGDRIVDQDVNSLKEMDNIYKDVKKKFR